MGVRSRTRKLTGKAAKTTRDTLTKVPGPSTNPATNLLIMDIAMRGASMLAGRAIERAFLRLHYHPEKAADIVKGRTVIRSMVSNGAARMASRSVPGFFVVAGGLVAKAIVDRSFGPRKSKQQGEEQLAEQAAQAED